MLTDQEAARIDEAREFYAKCDFGRSLMAMSHIGNLLDIIARLSERPEVVRSLALSDLENMDGEPVFIQQGDGHQGWYIVRTGEPLHAMVPLGAERDVWIVNDENPDGDGFDTDFINMEYDDPAGHYGLHVLGWRALRCKPNEGARMDAGKERS